MRVEATPLFTIAAAGVSVLALTSALIFNFALPVAHDPNSSGSHLNAAFALASMAAGAAAAVALSRFASKRKEKYSTPIITGVILGCFLIFGVAMFLQSYSQSADRRRSALAAAWGATGNITSVLVQSDNKIVLAGAGLARILPDGLPDPDFNRIVRFQGPASVPPLGTGAGDPVLMAQLDSGKIIVVDHYRIGCVLPGGADDPSFHPFAPPDHSTALAKQPDGRLLLAGVFDSSRRRIVRFLPDGSKDMTFRAAVLPDGHVRSIAIQPDGKILVAGWLKSVAHDWNARLVRLLADGTFDPDFEVEKITGEPPAGAAAKAFVLLQNGSSVISWQDPQGAFIVGHYASDGRRVPKSSVVDGLDDLPLTAFAIDRDGGLIAGSYGISRLSSTGDRDRDFSGPANGSWKIHEIQMQGDKILVIDTDNKLTRLQSNGEIDLKFQVPSFPVYSE